MMIYDDLSAECRIRMGFDWDVPMNYWCLLGLQVSKIRVHFVEMLVDWLQHRALGVARTGLLGIERLNWHIINRIVTNFPTSISWDKIGELFMAHMNWHVLGEGIIHDHKHWRCDGLNCERCLFSARLEAVKFPDVNMLQLNLLW